jgi:hypothetical protein
MAMSQQSEVGLISKRGAKRDSVFMLTELKDGAGRSLGPARIRNLSATGMMAECDVALRRGDHMACDLRGIGVVTGLVSWERNGRIGVSFDAPIDPKAVRRRVSGPSPEATAYVLARWARPAKPA